MKPKYRLAFWPRRGLRFSFGVRRGPWPVFWSSHGTRTAFWTSHSLDHSWQSTAIPILAISFRKTLPCSLRCHKIVLCILLFPCWLLCNLYMSGIDNVFSTSHAVNFCTSDITNRKVTHLMFPTYHCWRHAAKSHALTIFLYYCSTLPHKHEMQSCLIFNKQSYLQYMLVFPYFPLYYGTILDCEWSYQIRLQFRLSRHVIIIDLVTPLIWHLMFTLCHTKLVLKLTHRAFVLLCFHVETLFMVLTIIIWKLAIVCTLCWKTSW